MKILGIIAEYNPFHNGHKYHINKSKEIINPDYTIAVMSGNFVQRGEPAIFDKWTRAKFAAENGIDAVIELPVEFSLSTAERFAFGGVSLLNDLCVTHISFGTENSIDEITDIFNKFSHNEKKITLLSKNSHNYLKSRDEILGCDSVLKFSNNILGFEYLKALKKLKSEIIPIAIKRYGADHDSMDTKNDIASASFLRYNLTDVEASKFSPCCFDNLTPVTKSLFSDLINYKIISSDIQKLAQIAEIREGLENRIYKYGLLNLDVNTLIESVKSKRYTYTAISRILFQILLDIKKNDLNCKPLYARVLAANKKGTEFLNTVKHNTKIPLITKPSSIYNFDRGIIKQAEKDFLATDIYKIVTKSKKTGKVDLTTSPVILK